MLSRSQLSPLLFAALATATSCSSAPDITIPEVAIDPKQNDTSAPVQRPPQKRSFQANVATALCGARDSCSVVGIDPSTPNSPILVATVHLGVEGDTDGRAEPAFSRDGDSYEFPMTSFGSCHRFEVWRVQRSEDDGIAEKQKLFEICNDGHGAAGMGEDEFLTHDGVLTRETSGGSSWRWSLSTTMSLDPLRLLKEESSGHWALGDNNSEETWDWAALRGRETWETTRCTATPGPSGPPIFARVLIPDLTLPREFVEGEWKTTSLAECAAKVDGEASGFALEGQEDPRSARLSVVMSGNHLFVEAFDDVFTKKGAKVADAIVVHFAEDAPTYMDHCLGDPEAPDKIEVPLEGKMKRTGASAKSATVEAAPPTDASSPFRLHVHFAKPVPYFTVEYRDSEDGKRLARSIATSALEPGDDATLGSTRSIPSRRLQCVQQGGKLEVSWSRKLEPERPWIE